jgi:hypothetical protein
VFYAGGEPSNELIGLQSLGFAPERRVGQR